jgi:hypothetical protein
MSAPGVCLCLLAVARSSIMNASLALLAAALAAPGLSLPAPWSAPAAWLGAWRGGLLLAGLWAAGAAVLEVVFTETVDVSSLDLVPTASSSTNSSGEGGGGSRDPTPALIAALQHKNPLVQVRGGTEWVGGRGWGGGGGAGDGRGCGCV